MQKRIQTQNNCSPDTEEMVTKSKRDVEIRKNAKNCMLTFLNSIKHHELNGKNVYALLKSRNHGDYPALQELLGLSEDETFQFFLLINLVQGNKSYLRVNEKEVESITRECELRYCTVDYYIDRKKPAKAYFISFGAIDERKNDTRWNIGDILNLSKLVLQHNARKLMAEYAGIEATPGFMTPLSKSLRSPASKELISTASKASINNNGRCRKATTPISDSPRVVQMQNYKRSNCNETPANFKSDHRQTKTNDSKCSSNQSSGSKTNRHATVTPTQLYLENEDVSHGKEGQFSPKEVPMNIQDDSFCSILDTETSSLSANVIPEQHPYHEPYVSENAIPHNEHKNPQQENPYYQDKVPLNVTEPYNQWEQHGNSPYYYFWPQNLPHHVTAPNALAVEQNHGQTHFNFNSGVFKASTTDLNSRQHHNFDATNRSSVSVKHQPLKNTSHPNVATAVPSENCQNVNSAAEKNLQQYIHSCLAKAIQDYVAKLIVDSSGTDENYVPFIVSAIVGASTASIGEKNFPHLSEFWGISVDELQEHVMEYTNSGGAYLEKLPKNWFIRYSKQDGRPIFISYVNSDGIEMKISSLTHPSSKSFSLEKCTYEPCGTTEPQNISSITRQQTAAGPGENRNDRAGFSGTTPTSTDASPSTKCSFSEDSAEPSTTTTNTADGTATNGANSDSQFSSKLNWCSARTLKSSLQGRTNLQREEIEIARLLNQVLMTTNQSGVESLVFPRGRGQTEDSIFYKKPGTRRAKYSVRTIRKIVQIVVDMCNECSITLVSLVIALAKLEEQNISIQLKKNHLHNNFELIEESMSMIKISRIPHNAYHEIRMFADIVWNIELGAPIKSISKYIIEKCPSDDCTSSVLSLQVGSNDASADRKFKDCGVWRVDKPWDMFGTKLNYEESLGVLLPSSEISSESDDTILIVSNIDKGSDRTAVMVRIMNEDKGNSGKSTIVLGLILDGANECYENLKKAFFHDGNPIKYTLQSLLDNTFVAIRLVLRSTTAGKACVTAWAVFSCLVVSQLQSFPDHSNIKIKEIEGNQYLKSSKQCPTIKTLDELGSLYLLQQKESKSYVAVALVSDSGTPLTWVTLGEEAINSKETEITSISWKVLKGFEASDAKMVCLLNGHQGPASKCPCPVCIATQAEIDNGLSTTVYREGMYSPMNSYKKYAEFGSRIGKKDDDARRDLSLNITKPPLLFIPHDKCMFEPCHTLSGNVQHIDKEMVKACVEAEKKSLIYREAQVIFEGLTKDLEEAMKERKIRVTSVKYDRKNVDELRGFIPDGANPVLYAGVFHQLNITTQNAKAMDNGLKELDEYITCIKEDLTHIKQYLNSESDFLTVQVINHGYLSVAKVLLSQYHGGRKFLFRDSMSVAVNFDAIVAFCVDFIRAVTSNSDPLFIEKFEEALDKAKACLAHLGELSKMAESQKKWSPGKSAAFKKLCLDFTAEVKQQYPHLKLWLKAHYTDKHLWRIPEIYGFLGRGNAQGFESTHVKLNKYDHLCRAMKGSERFMNTFQKKMRSMDLAAIGKVERDFDAHRIKVSSRKPVARTRGDDTHNTLLTCEVTSEMTVFFHGKEYTRRSLTKCSLCGKTYPSKSKKFHMMYSHTISCAVFENNNFEEPPMDSDTTQE